MVFSEFLRRINAGDVTFVPPRWPPQRRTPRLTTISVDPGPPELILLKTSLKTLSLLGPTLLQNLPFSRQNFPHFQMRDPRADCFPIGLQGFPKTPWISFRSAATVLLMVLALAGLQAQTPPAKLLAYWDFNDQANFNKSLD